jgi:site-specific DNA-methyltransferase (adenine-specific)
MITNDHPLRFLLDSVIPGDCAEEMQRIPNEIIDLVVTDPPYIARYKDRDARRVLNDDNWRWITPAFSQVYRVLKQDSYCVSFYGWQHIEKLMTVWKFLGFYPVAHLVWQKRYPSKRGIVGHMHEQAFVLAKGRPSKPSKRLPDVLPWEYSGNGLHPTEKAVSVVKPLIRAFSKQGDIVLDPFCGSGSTLLAAREIGRRFIGIEKDQRVFEVLHARLEDLRREETKREGA